MRDDRADLYRLALRRELLRHGRTDLLPDRSRRIAEHGYYHPRAFVHALWLAFGNAEQEFDLDKWLTFDDLVYHDLVEHQLVYEEEAADAAREAKKMMVRNPKPQESEELDFEDDEIPEV